MIESFFSSFFILPACLLPPQETSPSIDEPHSYTDEDDTCLPPHILQKVGVQEVPPPPASGRHARASPSMPHKDVREACFPAFVVAGVRQCCR